MKPKDIPQQPPDKRDLHTQLRELVAWSDRLGYYGRCVGAMAPALHGSGGHGRPVRPVSEHWNA